MEIDAFLPIKIALEARGKHQIFLDLNPKNPEKFE